MKKTVLSLTMCLFLAAQLFSQDFVSTENQWNVRVSSFGGVTTQIFFIDGDTSFNAIDYQKIWLSSDSLQTRSYFGMVRQEGDVVYYVPENGTEGLMYDFSLTTNETVMIKNYFCGDSEVPVTVLDVDTVEYMGVERRRLLIDEADEEYWIEGIGSTNGPAYSQIYQCIVCPVWELLCFSHQNELLYILPGEEECWQQSVSIGEVKTEDVALLPNPVIHGQPFEIQTSLKITRIKIISTSGVVVDQYEFSVDKNPVIQTKSLKPGFYLLEMMMENGEMLSRKVLVK